jgi:5-methyltetrahydropteroyltriglutamate--homocysteine methyltransferase
VAGGDFKFTLTSPYMLARTLLDNHYHDLEALTLAIADALAAQVADLDCACVQVDEANIPGNPADGPLAAQAINRILDQVKVKKAVHFCFGNYGGQTIQRGAWQPLLDFLNALRTDHLVLELAHRPAADLDALKDLDPKIGVGLGVVDIKVNHIESADEIARRIESAEQKLGAGRVQFIHPDCGFWMLKRSVADRKIAALAKGRDLFEGR